MSRLWQVEGRTFFETRCICFCAAKSVVDVDANVAAVSSVPMQNVAKPTRGRSMSMQDYDIPLRKRMNSTQMTCSPVIDASPSSVDGDGAAAAGGAGGGAALPAAEQLVAN